MEQLYEAINRIPEKLRYPLILAVGAVIVALYVFLVRFPALDQLEKLERQLSDAQQKYQAKKAIADDLQYWQLELQRLEARFEEARNQLPAEIDTDQLLIIIPNLAKKNGLEVKEFAIASEVQKGTYAEIPMKLKMHGTYKGVGGFAQDVGNQARIMALTAVKMKAAARRSRVEQTPPAGEESEVPLDIEGTVVTYRYVEKGGAAGASAQGGRPR